MVPLQHLVAAAAIYGVTAGRVHLAQILSVNGLNPPCRKVHAPHISRSRVQGASETLAFPSRDKENQLSASFHLSLSLQCKTEPISQFSYGLLTRRP